MDISIGELSEQTGVKVPTVRYYEQVGLLPVPLRTEGKQRRYDTAAVSRLKFIRHARQLGFEVPAIRELLMLSAQPERSCAEVDNIAKRHMAEVEHRIEQLTSLLEELQEMQAGQHGVVKQCRILETLNEQHD